ncbi:MAG: hypothetical protein IT348_11055 [Candidatus Eisenbacteria bacterium]|nr:hypothetical protein [Candidatus Eisenbacteria bacterium]
MQSKRASVHPAPASTNLAGMENEAMGIGEILRGYFGDQQQKAVALEWGQKWAELTGKTYTASHLASSLSRLMKNDPVGIRFFFLTPEKGEPLFDLLDVPHDQRRHIRKMANELLVPVEQQPARLLVNITPWHGTRDELDQVFRAVESVVLREHGLFPAVLVLTEEQYRALPRTFDDWKARVRICRVTPEEADSVLEDEAGVEGLVLSPTRFPDYSRWAAIAVRSGSLVLEPPDAFEVFQKRGALAPLPRIDAPVGDDVDGDGGGHELELPDDPLRLRRLMWELSTEQGARDLGWSAGDRLALGRRLGISVASTESERVDARLAMLGRQLAAQGVRGVASCSTDELARVLLRAKTRETGPTVLRVDGSLHLINIPAEVAEQFANEPIVRVHAVKAPSSPLARVLGLLSTWVHEDYLRDPFLESALPALAVPGEDERLVVHARTSLLRCPAKPPERHGDLVPDPLVVLGALLGPALPPVTARLVPKRSEGRPVQFVAVLEKVRSQLSSDEPWLSGRPRWLDDVVATESDRIVWVSLEEWHGDEQSGRLSYEPQIREARPLHFPPDRWTPTDEDTWLSMVEHSPAFGMAPIEPDFNRIEGSHSSRGPVRGRVYKERGTVGWEGIRAQAAQLWQAIRRAVAGGNCVSMGPGVVLLDLAAGVSASVSLRVWPGGTGKPLEVRVPVSISGKGTDDAEMLSVVTADFETGFRVGSYRESRTLPSGLELCGEGVVVTVILTVNTVTAASLGANGLATIAAADD